LHRFFNPPARPQDSIVSEIAVDSDSDSACNQTIQGICNFTAGGMVGWDRGRDDAGGQVSGVEKAGDRFDKKPGIPAPPPE